MIKKGYSNTCKGNKYFSIHFSRRGLFPISRHFSPRVVSYFEKNK